MEGGTKGIEIRNANSDISHFARLLLDTRIWWREINKRGRKGERRKGEEPVKRALPMLPASVESVLEGLG